ncbi:helix-turn-helix transcriptional regulator [Skermanella aerolata]|uniref:helix-turn-helix transcriptional regulator n=1 Tax=Skermanella aerolata TaxID=393310 RepID=UPI003D21684A
MAQGEGEGLITPLELAERLKVKPRTLQDWRSSGKGPQFVRAGRAIRYRQSDIDAWLQSQVERVE